MVKKRMERRKCGEQVIRPIKTEVRLRGVTSCAKCKIKDVQDCRERLLALGLDCKKINVNALPDEITVGLTAEGQ